MVTFEHGKAPAWACATWYRLDESSTAVMVCLEDSIRIYTLPQTADRLCRALSLAKLAEDWAGSVRDVRAIFDQFGDMFAGNAESDAACDKSDAARAALLKACAE